MTPSVKQGLNEIKAGVIGLGSNHSFHYQISLETIVIIDGPSFRARIATLDFESARARILSRLNSSDPDIEIVQSTIVANLTDPFTSKLHGSLPVRGITCKHDQCFDLEIFLATRTARLADFSRTKSIDSNQDPNTPCRPEALRCPICKADARPQSLVIDGFFLSVHESLK